MLKAVAASALAVSACSLAPAIWADPPSLESSRAPPPEGGDAVALFRAAGPHGLPGREEAVRSALSGRFSPGSDAAAAVAFLTAAGPGGAGKCQPLGAEDRRRGYYCHIGYGSFAASLLGFDRWRLQEWVVGITLERDSDAIERIGVRVPFFGKG